MLAKTRVLRATYHGCSRFGRDERALLALGSRALGQTNFEIGSVGVDIDAVVHPGVRPRRLGFSRAPRPEEADRRRPSPLYLGEGKAWRKADLEACRIVIVQSEANIETHFLLLFDRNIVGKREHLVILRTSGNGFCHQREGPFFGSNGAELEEIDRDGVRHRGGRELNEATHFILRHLRTSQTGATTAPTTA